MNNTISDHKQLIASLSDEQRKVLTQKSDILGLFHLCSHLMIIFLTGYWILNGWIGWQGILVFHGVLLVFLFTLLHETVHFTVFKTPLLNTLVGWLCAVLLFLPPNWFRYYHLAHHRHTHDPEKDPELDGEEGESLAEFIWDITGFPVWSFQIKSLLKNAFRKPQYDYVPAKGYLKIKQEAQMMLAIYASVFVISVYLQTTVWNMPYHAEHHAYPAIPFHQLPNFHEVAKTHLKTTENGYIQFQKKNIQTIMDFGEQP